MPLIKSAKKRVKITRKATARNLGTKRAIKSAVKDLQAAIAKKDSKKALAAFSSAQSALDIAAKKNIMHRNKVARKQRQLAKQARAAGVKPAAAPKATKASHAKPAAKKPAAKKAAPKKTAKNSAAMKTTK